MSFRSMISKAGLLLLISASISFVAVQTPETEAPQRFPALKGFVLTGKEQYVPQSSREADKNSTAPTEKIYIYTFSQKAGTSPPTPVQLENHYAQLLNKAPGKKSIETNQSKGQKLFSGGYVHNGREVWITVGDLKLRNSDSAVIGYTLKYLENTLPGYVKAEDMSKQIATEGKSVLDIQFEEGKSMVKDESLSQVYELVTMLRNDPYLKVSIEVHSDKSGSAVQNRELSVQRAKAIRDIVRRKGIDPGRLSTEGWGSSKPVSDNKTEMGRAKNRRVEIVKK